MLEFAMHRGSQILQKLCWALFCYNFMFYRDFQQYICLNNNTVQTLWCNRHKLKSTELTAFALQEPSKMNNL